MANGPEGEVLPEAGMAANVTGQTRAGTAPAADLFPGQRAGIAPPDQRSKRA